MLALAVLHVRTGGLSLGFSIKYICCFFVCVLVVCWRSGDMFVVMLRAIPVPHVILRGYVCVLLAMLLTTLPVLSSRRPFPGICLPIRS